MRTSATTWRRSATFVTKILKGAKPGDLPIEQLTKIGLVIKGKAATVPGMTIAPFCWRERIR